MTHAKKNSRNEDFPLDAGCSSSLHGASAYQIKQTDSERIHLFQI
jgi:hypothetical protein